jgi:hypothetical protein
MTLVDGDYDNSKELSMEMWTFTFIRKSKMKCDKRKGCLWGGWNCFMFVLHCLEAQVVVDRKTSTMEWSSRGISLVRYREPEMLTASAEPWRVYAQDKLWLEDHPLSSERDCLFCIFAATLHIWRPSPVSHAVLTTEPLNVNYILKIYILWRLEEHSKSHWS